MNLKKPADTASIVRYVEPLGVGPASTNCPQGWPIQVVSCLKSPFSTKKATALSGRIRAKVLEHDTTQTSEASPWAGPIEVWTKEVVSRWNQGEERVKFVPLEDPYSRSRSELEEDGWTYQETINEEGGRQ